MTHYVIIPASHTRHTTTFLLDSQADISVIKSSSLLSDTLIDTLNITNIIGITDGKVQSLGTTTLSLLVDHSTLSHSITVVPNDFPIPTDGILGKDFMAKYKCNLDYLSMTFTVRLASHLVSSVSIYTEDLKGNTIVIPPRCEVVQNFQFHVQHKEDQVLDQQEIATGVFVARSLVSFKNPVLRVLNTTNKSITLSRVLNIKSKNISEFDEVKIQSCASNEERISKLKSVLGKNIKNYNSFSHDLIELCIKYHDIFILEGDKLTTNNFYTQSLNVTDPAPVYVKNYRMPHSQKEEVRSQLNNLLKNDIIEPSKSSYNSPIILVPKKSPSGDKKWRMCIDFRLLNKKLVPDKYPLPRMDDVLDNLGRAKWFSTLDLFSGFFQIPLDKKSKKYTSFSTPEGSFQYKVLPFGLNVAPNSFARMMALAFSGLKTATCFLYLDDIIVPGVSESHHLKNLELVFKTCKSHNLKLNPDKCIFLRSEVNYLGHICTDKGILPDSSKFEVIKNYPTPHDKDSVRRFVAFINYYNRFIPNFSSLANPLNKLLRKKSIFLWTSECDESFKTLKNCLLSPTILQYPKFDEEFIVTVDAAKYGVGAVLSQVTNGNDLPIAFASKAFTKGELNKSTIEKELTAIHFAIKHFKPYLFGVKFLVRSDHKPLKYLFSMKDPSSKLSRMRLDLCDYNFDIEYLKGSDNVVADALSRIDFQVFKDLLEQNNQILAITRSKTRITPTPSTSYNTTVPQQVEPTHAAQCINNKQVSKTSHELVFSVANHNKIYCSLLSANKTIFTTEADPIDFSIDNGNLALKAVFALLDQVAVNKNITEVKIKADDAIFSLFSQHIFKELANEVLNFLFVWVMRPILPIRSAVEQRRLLQQYHSDSLSGGHSGIKRTYEKLRSSYWWKGMAKDVSNYVKDCPSCSVNKPRPYTREELKLTDTPDEPFEELMVDTVGPLEISEAGNRYLLTAVCNFSKFLISVPIPNKEAKTVATAIVDNVVLAHGPPKSIVTDLGTEFKNQVLSEIFSLLNVNHNFSTAYHHETLGTVERNHRTFNEYLRAYLKEDRHLWDHYSKFFTFCYNTTPNSAIDYYTPFEMVYGRRPRTLGNQDIPTTPVYNLDNYAQELKHCLSVVHARVKQFTVSNKTSIKTSYDKHARVVNFKLGDSCLLRNEARHKLDPLFDAFWEIVAIEGQNAKIKHKNTNKTMIVHKNRLVLE